MLFLLLSILIFLALQKSAQCNYLDLVDLLETLRHPAPPFASKSSSELHYFLKQAKRKALSIEKPINLIYRQIETSIEYQQNKSSFQKIYFRKGIMIAIFLFVVRTTIMLSNQNDSNAFLATSWLDSLTQVVACGVWGYGLLYILSKYPKDWFYDRKITPNGKDWIGGLLLKKTTPETSLGQKQDKVLRQERLRGKSLDKERLQLFSLWAVEQNITSKERLQIYENFLPIADLVIFISTTVLVQGPLFTGTLTQFLR